MKLLLLLSTLLLTATMAHSQSCSDTAVYANIKQTKFDRRFSAYKLIKGQPKYSGGSRKLEKYIREHLIVIPELKNDIFNLNYQVTISCDGKIIDAKTLGDKRFGEITNFIEIAYDTDGDWKPAKKNGKKVNCIYFGRMYVNGSLYQK